MKLDARVEDRVHEVSIERRDGQFRVTVDGTPHLADVRQLQGGFYTILMNGRSYEISVEPDGDTYRVRHGAAVRVVTLSDPASRARHERRAADEGRENVVTVMPGKVVRVLVSEGECVEAGQGLVVVEAMKMENEIAAPRAGRVAAVQVVPGRAVEAGATLVVLE